MCCVFPHIENFATEIFNCHKIITISTGDITIVGSITLGVDSDLSGPSPQFTLTCISTGGPATTVTWTRDSTTVTEGNETVLNDPETAQYTHTLTVTGNIEGLYTCAVGNNRPSNDSACILVHFPLEQPDPLPVTLLPLNATAVTVSWNSSPTFPTSLHYSSSLTTTGLVMTHHTEILPPGLGSTDISLDDEFDGCKHNFTLHYVVECDAPVFETNYVFGKQQ